MKEKNIVVKYRWSSREEHDMDFIWNSTHLLKPWKSIMGIIEQPLKINKWRAYQTDLTQCYTLRHMWCCMLYIVELLVVDQSLRRGKGIIHWYYYSSYPSPSSSLVVYGTSEQSDCNLLSVACMVSDPTASRRGSSPARVKLNCLGKREQ